MQTTPDSKLYIQKVAVADSKVWDGSPYYESAENDLSIFWGDKSIFREFYKSLDLKNILELATGHGRHSEYILKSNSKNIDSLIAMDILQSNVDYTATRLSDFSKAKVLKNSGADFLPIETGRVSAVFCYDAMVHFHRDVVKSYLLDTARVLIDGGGALFHHSNYSLDPDSQFGKNPHARAYMSAELFKKYAEDFGLVVVNQKKISWGNVIDLDCLTLVKKV
jgi:ubiquinone/menaquinone biosynthesis C-methylase UbiE